MSQRELMEILMVEDNIGDIELIKIAFKEGSLQCNINVAYDGQEGIEYLRKEGSHGEAKTPDLILLDINMPRMSGKEVLDVIKNDDCLKVIPVIVLTSSQAELDIVETYKKHANTYIIKPDTMDEFIDMARSISDFWGRLAKLPKVSS